MTAGMKIVAWVSLGLNVFTFVSILFVISLVEGAADRFEGLASDKANEFKDTAMREQKMLRLFERQVDAMEGQVDALEDQADVEPTQGGFQDNSARTASTSKPLASQTSPTSRSLPAFGHCVAHYLREVRYLPTELPLGDGVVNITRSYDTEAQQWMSIGLCLEHSPRPAVDDTSGKCIVSAMQWYMREHPESGHIAPVVAAVSCLPAYQPDGQRAK